MIEWLAKLFRRAPIQFTVAPGAVKVDIHLYVRDNRLTGVTTSQSTSGPKSC